MTQPEPAPHSLSLQKIQPRSDRTSKYAPCLDDLKRARSALIEAELAERASDRFLAAHLAALRVAAVVLAVRTKPSRRSRGPRNAWQVLAQVAPELGEWAAFFAASQDKREAVRAGAVAIVSTREADDLIRDANTFLGLVERDLRRATRLRGVKAAMPEGEVDA